MNNSRYALIVALFFSHSLFACGIPVDKDGDTIPVPSGDIPYFSMPSALCADANEYTWDYSGTLKNANTLFSFQSSLVQVKTTGAIHYGFNIFQFSFQNGGDFFFANSTYGGESNVKDAVNQSLDQLTSSATQTKFALSASLLTDPSRGWTVKSYGTPVAQPPLYKGLVGQPGHQYQMIGTGETYLWRYNADGTHVIASYQYTVNLIMIDQRGSVMEGLGGGYVGPMLVPQSSVNSLVESELGQPRLKVLSWSVTFKAIGNTSTPGFQPVYSFSGNNGMLWNDFGPLDSPNKHVFSNVQNKAITNAIYQQQKITPDNAAEVMNGIGQEASASLYNGNWIPVTFTKGKYAGASVVFSTFWNKTDQYPTDQSTDNFPWSNFGWANLYTGIIPNEVTSASSIIEALYPENPVMPQTAPANLPSYSVALNQFVPQKFNEGFPWVQDLTITIKANTKLRYALAAYANDLSKSEGGVTAVDDPTQDLVITVSAISPVTQNTLFSDQISQYYEGAAVPEIDGQAVGYAWIEHMVKN